MTLQEAKDKLYKCLEDIMGPRNMSLTEIERIKVRVLVLKAVIDIMLQEERNG